MTPDYKHSEKREQLPANQGFGLVSKAIGVAALMFVANQIFEKQEDQPFDSSSLPALVASHSNFDVNDTLYGFTAVHLGHPMQAVHFLRSLGDKDLEALSDFELLEKSKTIDFTAFSEEQLAALTLLSESELEKSRGEFLEAILEPLLDDLPIIEGGYIYSDDDGLSDHIDAIVSQIVEYSGLGKVAAPQRLWDAVESMIVGLNSQGVYEPGEAMNTIDVQQLASIFHSSVTGGIPIKLDQETAEIAGSYEAIYIKTSSLDFYTQHALQNGYDNVLQYIAWMYESDVGSILALNDLSADNALEVLANERNSFLIPTTLSRKDYYSVDVDQPAIPRVERVRGDMEPGAKTVSESPLVHIVVEGDNLTKIAQRYDTTLEHLKELNNFTEAQTHALKIGQEIKLIGQQKIHTVGVTSDGGSLWAISREYGVSVAQLKAANDIAADNNIIHPGDKLIIPTSESPVIRITKDFTYEDLAVDTSSILEWEEGGKMALTAYCPYNIKTVVNSKGKKVKIEQYKESGVTVAGGVDLGQHSIESLLEMGISKAIVRKLSPYIGKKDGKDTGMKGAKAKNFLKTHPLVLSQAEAEEVNLALRNYIYVQGARSYNRMVADHCPEFVDLTPEQQTFLASRFWHKGQNCFGRGDSFHRAMADYIEDGDWNGVVRHLGRAAEFYDSEKENGIINRMLKEQHYLNESLRRDISAKEARLLEAGIDPQTYINHELESLILKHVRDEGLGRSGPGICGQKTSEILGAHDDPGVKCVADRDSSHYPDGKRHAYRMYNRLKQLADDPSSGWIEIKCESIDELPSGAVVCWASSAEEFGVAGTGGGSSTYAHIAMVIDGDLIADNFPHLVKSYEDKLNFDDVVGKKMEVYSLVSYRAGGKKETYDRSKKVIKNENGESEVLGVRGFVYIGESAIRLAQGEEKDPVAKQSSRNS